MNTEAINSKEQEAIEKSKYVAELIATYRKGSLDNYIRLAGVLEGIKCSSFWLLLPTAYYSVYEYISKEFGLSKSTVNNYIAVAKRFGIGFQEIESAYRDYDLSQLIAMLSLKDDQLSRVSVSSTVAEINAIKAENKPVKVDDPTIVSPDTSQLIIFTKSTFDKLKIEAKSNKIDVPTMVIKIIEMYFATQ
jgi:hypothetical protein